MDLVEFREYCLSHEGVTEKMPFGKFAKRYDSILAFYVRGHMFAFIDIEDFSWVNVRSTPEGIMEIRERYDSVANPVNQSLRYWISLKFDGDITDEAIYGFVRRSYDTVRAKYKVKP